MAGRLLLLPLLFSLYDHQTELAVVELVVTAGVKLGESNGNLVLCEVPAHVTEFLFCHES